MDWQFLILASKWNVLIDDKLWSTWDVLKFLLKLWTQFLILWRVNVQCKLFGFFFNESNAYCLEYEFTQCLQEKKSQCICDRKDR